MSNGLRVITMTAFRRPLYTQQVLRALADCDGIGDFIFCPQIEPGYDEVIAAFDGWDACEIRAEVNRKKRGLNENTHKALSRAADYGASMVLHVEDDTVLSLDALRYFRWAVEEAMPRLSEAVVLASGYNKPAKAPTRSQRFQAATRGIWTPWGWAVDRKRLQWLLKKWRFRNPRCFTCPFKNRFRKTRREIFPLLSRVQNIGYERGENRRTPDWYRENHTTPWVAGKMPSKPFTLIGDDAAGLKAKVKRYVSAIGRWRAAGSPVRSEEAVKRIYQEECRPCEHFDAKRKTCRVCGCKVSNSSRALVNKIKMATERCPKGKWGPADDGSVNSSSGE